MTTPREMIRAAYLYGVQEGAQAAVEKFCDEYLEELPPRVHTALWEARHKFAAELREAALDLFETEGLKLIRHS